MGRPGAVRGIKNPARTQLTAQRQQHIKHHAHTGHRLALKAAAGLIRVDDDIGIGQLHRARTAVGGGQMVVGHQDLQAQLFGVGHALHAGNAVVHGDQHIGAGIEHALRNRRGQAIAIDHAVGHQIAHMFGTQQAQAAQGHSAGGGAVAVVVGHDAQLLVPGDGVGQQHGSFACAHQRGGRQETGQAIVELVHAGDAARRIQACQQGVNAGLLQGPGAARGDVTGGDLHFFWGD